MRAIGLTGKVKCNNSNETKILELTDKIESLTNEKVQLEKILEDLKKENETLNAKILELTEKSGKKTKESE